MALIKANPDKLRMSTAGAGTAGHFAGEMFIAMTGIEPLVVHYNGGGPAIEAVVTGDSQWTMAPIAGRLPHVSTGKLRACASRSAAAPVCRCCPADVPTIAEIRLSGPSTRSAGAASFVPNGTPQAIIDKLNATIAKAVANPEARKQFADQGTEPAASTQAEMARMLRDDYARLGELAKRIGVSVD